MRVTRPGSKAHAILLTFSCRGLTGREKEESAAAQADKSPTIEGFWQDIAGRTTFMRNVPPTSTYGAWNECELDATYPQAKHIHRSGKVFELSDLNYDRALILVSRRGRQYHPPLGDPAASPPKTPPASKACPTLACSPHGGLS
jgi:hypothetical protein